ncbi:MAG: hypothetical protein H6828_03580 [Planctomycetes bacterium]|nr:hypothetical protein [Planctomycetota bacterium]
MQIHRIRGNDLKDALQRARRQYGEGALVISHERTADGGVSLAVAERSSGGAAAVVAAQQPEPLAPPVDPAAFDGVRERLARSGCSAEWIDRMVERASAAATADQHPMDGFGAFIGRELRIAHLPKSQGVTRVVAFVGNTGVGKTTGLAKLGARLVRGQRLVGLATLDSRRVGAVEQARAYAELLGAPVRALRPDQVLTAEALGAAGRDVVLLDTTGRPQSDAPQLAALQRELGREGADARLDTFLVFPASTSRAALREVTEAYGDLRLSGCVITKLDETREPGPVLEHVMETGLPLAFVSDGQDLGRDFHRATPDLVADLFLLGRLA